MSEQENTEQVRYEFLKSRDWAIIRCASIMVESGKEDLAKQILTATKIDRKRFEEIKAQST